MTEQNITITQFEGLKCKAQELGLMVTYFEMYNVKVVTFFKKVDPARGTYIPVSEEMSSLSECNAFLRGYSVSETGTPCIESSFDARHPLVQRHITQEIESGVDSLLARVDSRLIELVGVRDISDIFTATLMDELSKREANNGD